MPLLLCIEQH